MFNGIDARSGGYLTSPLEPEALLRLARGESLAPSDRAELAARAAAKDAHYGVVEGIDSRDLAQAGWGVVYPYARPGTEEGKRLEAIREALRPLLELRRSQAAARDERFFKEYAGGTGYRAGESKQKFLARNGAAPGAADPVRVPYYLLLVGSPEQVPFRVQAQIDVQYAVGRIDFPTLDAYAAYASSVVRAETGAPAPRREVAFFGTAHPGDAATLASARQLIAPLAERLRLRPEAAGFELRAVLEGDATKARLRALVGGSGTPSLLVAAAHGMGFPNGDVLQLRHQGALLCQDWPGPVEAAGKPITPDLYLSPDDLDDGARLEGLVAFLFACYGAGTPKEDEYSRALGKERASIAPLAFTAPLAQRMLGHPKGGALAVIGHVERAWGDSFLWEGTRAVPDGGPSQLGTFESTLARLLAGYPVGAALEPFNQRYAEISSDLTVKLEEIDLGARYPGMETELARMWTANNDARGYAVVGDPAVRLVPRTGAVAATAPATGTPVEVGRVVTSALPVPAPSPAAIPAHAPLATPATIATREIAATAATVPSAPGAPAAIEERLLSLPALEVRTALAPEPGAAAGPWLLTRIEPDGRTETTGSADALASESLVRLHLGALAHARAERIHARRATARASAERPSDGS